MKAESFKRVFKLVSPETAQSQLLKAACIKPLGPEKIPLENSPGRVLAVDIFAERDIPEKNRAVFDGYAVRAANTQKASMFNPIRLKVIGKTFPEGPMRRIASGETVFIACGAPIPKGADAVVKVENVRVFEETIEICSPVEPGENVAFAGEDVRKGQLLLKKGCFLRPQDVGLLAGMGIKSVKVFEKPKVAIISVGDELVKLSKEEPHRIVNNYALIVSYLVSELGAAPQLFGIVPDNLEEIKKTISEALRKAHLVVTIAGCSVGPKDLVPDAVAALSGRGLVFHGVRLSPGKVMGAGIVDGKPVVMLPGHIISAYAGFYLLIAPLIAQYTGLGDSFPFPVVRAKITKGLKARPINTFLRVRLTSLNGEFLAEPIRGGSSVLNTLINSNGYTIVPKGRRLKKGETIKVVLYDRYEYGHMQLFSKS
jgi:molybdenum cofactor synthesis domain-containing protein